MNRLTLEQIKQIELELLKDFAAFCDQNHLYYTLCGGTLLGAVRHKGFIPWDDDIDVLMPRPDFERLLQGEGLDFGVFKSHEKLVHWKNGSLNYPFAKLLDMRTKLKVDYVDEKMDAGHLWIDIFPIDGCPNTQGQLKKLYLKSMFWRRLLLLRLAQKGEGKTKLKRILKPILIFSLRIIPVRFFCEKIDRLSCSTLFNENDYVCGISWGYGVQEKIQRKPYMIPVKVEFEGHLFNAPSNYHEYLSHLYGDYMKLPPEQQRVCHGMEAYI